MADPRDEGVVRFRSTRVDGPAPAGAEVDALLAARELLRRAGLIGVLPDGVGYGNISVRSGGGVIVTGTGTGGIELLTPEHLTRIVECDIAGNSVRCVGPVDASSETMTHMAAYAASPRIGAVAHGHHDGAWRRLCGVLPTTDREIPYGTPEMAREVEQLVRLVGPSLPVVIAMGGHQGGLIAVAATAVGAADALVRVVEESAEC